MGWIWSLALSLLLTVDEPHQYEWVACQKWRPSYPPRPTGSESAQRTPSTGKSEKSCSRLWSGKSHWTHRELCSSERWPCLSQSHLQWEGSANEKGLSQRHGHCCSLCPHSAMPANAHPSAAWPCNRFNSTPTDFIIYKVLAFPYSTSQTTFSQRAYNMKERECISQVSGAIALSNCHRFKASLTTFAVKLRSHAASSILWSTYVYLTKTYLSCQIVKYKLVIVPLLASVPFPVVLLDTWPPSWEAETHLSEVQNENHSS